MSFLNLHDLCFELLYHLGRLLTDLFDLCFRYLLEFFDLLLEIILELVFQPCLFLPELFGLQIEPLDPVLVIVLYLIF